LLCVVAERLAFLGAVDALQTDTLSFAVMQDLNGVPVEDSDYFASKRESGDAQENEQKQKEVIRLIK
jgi:hypothetical protein